MSGASSGAIQRAHTTSRPAHKQKEFLEREETMFDWIATQKERNLVLPGDDLLPEVKGSSTHAITIEASRETIWPWLLQMGCDRAGWYSHDFLDNGRNPSAEEIIPELQDVKEGDILPNRPGSTEGFEIIKLDKPELFALGAYLEIPKFNTIPWQEKLPRKYMRSTWLFVLQERDKDRTRLLVRARGVIYPWYWRILLGYCMAPAHKVMQRKQLLNLRERVENPENKLNNLL
ncbi:MAG: hypothetical protein GY754_03420 [bacterium]|nr:hypothetical protein [bacterium]